MGSSTLVLFVALLVSLVAAQQTAWVVQTVFRNAVSGCALQDVALVTSWLNNSCNAINATAWSLRRCNGTHIATVPCSNSACTTCSGEVAYPTLSCGAITTSNVTQGLFFACFVGSQPPALTATGNHVYNEQVFQGSSCSPLSLQQQLSAYSGVCALNEKRSCICSGSSCSSGSYSTTCNGTGSPITLGTCFANSGKSLTTQCVAASALTPAPVDPNNGNANGTNANDLVSCESATTRDQCVGRVATSNGKFTLAPSGLVNKCCVWCGSGAGSCRTPPFSQQYCTCPPQGANFSVFLKVTQCPSDSQLIDCLCGGKPPGVPVCSASYVSVFAALAMLLVAMAVL